jgi:hypothetical protein
MSRSIPPRGSRILLTLVSSYVSRHVLKGHKLFRDFATLSLHRVYRETSTDPAKPFDWSFMAQEESLELIDGSGAYLCVASIDAEDDNVSANKDLATTKLVELRDLLKPVMTLAPVDRLALDTRAPNK